MSLFRRRRSDPVELIQSQLGALLTKGHSIESALQTLTEALDEPARDLAVQLREAYAESRSLAAAVRRVPELSRPDLAELIATAEGAGADPSVVLKRYPHYQKSLGKILSVGRMRLTNRASYLVTVLGVFAVVLGVYSVFVFPQFAALYRAVDAPLPRVTAFLLDATGGIAVSAIALVAIVAVLLVIVLVSFKTWLGALKPWQRRARFVPLLGGIIRDLAGLRALCYLDVLAHAGVAFTRSAETVARLAGVPRALAQPHDAIAALRDTGLFNARALDLVSVSGKTGTLDLELKSHIDLEFDRLLDKASAIGNPVMFVLLIVLAIIIGTAVYAMYAPIFGLGTLI